MFSRSHRWYLGVLGLGALGWCSCLAAGPDLIVWGDAAAPFIETVNFGGESCEVEEVCAVPGTRKLLRFSMETRNVGDEDLYVGDPAENPLFHFAPCHGHFHFEAFAQYNLLDSFGQLVAEGHKAGFCIEDIFPWDPNASPFPRYHCSDQGIQAGWADVYDASLPCQYIDITGVPPGDYTLQLIINPLQQLPETDYGNNVTEVAFTIPSTCTPPANDSFAAATLVPAAPASLAGNTACATRAATDPFIAGNWGGHSVWYRWVAPSTRSITINTAGSGFDTLLAVHAFDGGGLQLVAENDDVVAGIITWSTVTFDAVGGVEYRIQLDGFNWDFGTYVLNVAPPSNDLFADCAGLAGESGTSAGYTIGATVEPGEPSHAGTFGLHTVWYCWTPPSAGTYIFDTVGSGFNTALAVYTGTAVNNLGVVASDNYSGPNGASLVRFAATPGETYRVAVSGPGDTAGNLALNWRPHVVSCTLAVTVLGNDQVRLTISGTGSEYTILTSADLMSWATGPTLIAIQGEATYTETATSLAPRFFRVVAR